MLLQVIVGNDCELQPFSIALPGLSMPSKTVLRSLKQESAAKKQETSQTTSEGSTLSNSTMAIWQVSFQVPGICSLHHKYQNDLSFLSNV